MPSYTKQILSGSTDGLPINVTGTATGSANTIHTASASAKDELYLWVSNTSASDVTLTIEWGSVTNPGGLLMKSVTVPALSPPTQFAFGQVLTNSKVVKAFAGTTAVLNITGFVNRIS